MIQKKDPWGGFREAIRADRKMRGWNQQELADAAGMSRGALSDIERGKTADPERDSVERIARALDWPLERLEAVLKGTAPGEAPPPAPLSKEAMAGARRQLPRADAAVLEDYARKLTRLFELQDEIREMERQYGTEH